LAMLLLGGSLKSARGLGRLAGRARGYAARRAASTITWSSVEGGEGLRRPQVSLNSGLNAQRTVATVGESAWGKLGLGNEVSKALVDLDLSAPSEIQDLAIPAILGQEDIIFAAQTGSGKTLAYLAPLFSALKAAEAAPGYVASERRPRALVLVPTRELADQVLSVAKALSKSGARMSTRSIVGGSDGLGKQKKAVSGVVDIIVASPGRFIKLWEAGDVHVSKVAHVIVDEVDTMLVQGWAEDLKKLLKATMLREQFSKAKSPKAGGWAPSAVETTPRAQLVMTTATLTAPVRAAFASSDRTGEWGFVPMMRLIESKTLHRAVATLDHRSIDVGGRNKLDVLVQEVLRADAPKKKQRQGLTLVFCNTVASCRAVEHTLREQRNNDDDALMCYHGEMNSDERSDSLVKFRGKETAVLVCTDLAARGLDMPTVGHVVMFDFPRNPIDYLHRAGRTARFGLEGKVTALVTRSDAVLNAAIERGIANGEPLDDLTSDRKDYESGGRLRSSSPANKKDRPPSARSLAANDLRKAARGAKLGGKIQGKEKKAPKAAKAAPGQVAGRRKDTVGPRPATGKPELEKTSPSVRTYGRRGR